MEQKNNPKIQKEKNHTSECEGDLTKNRGIGTLEWELLLPQAGKWEKILDTWGPEKQVVEQFSFYFLPPCPKLEKEPNQSSPLFPWKKKKKTKKPKPSHLKRAGIPAVGKLFWLQRLACIAVGGYWSQNFLKKKKISNKNSCSSGLA